MGMGNRHLCLQHPGMVAAPGDGNCEWQAARAQFMYVGHWGIMAAGENNEKQQLRGLKKGRGKSRKLHQKPP